MQLTLGELHNLHKLILSCINCITNMSLYKKQVTDLELKAMIETQFSAYIKDYNLKVRFVREASSSNKNLNVPQLNINLQYFTNASAQPVPVTPITKIQQLNS